MIEASNRSNEDRFAVLDHISNGVLILRQDMTVVYWNSCLEHWTHIARSQIVGTRLTDRYPHLGMPKYQARLRILFEGGPPTIFSSQLHKHIIPSKLRNGQLRVQHTAVTSLSDRAGSGKMVLFNIQDVTELESQLQASRQAQQKALEEIRRRVKIESELAEANRKIEDKSKEMEQFAIVCAHDLKSPLWSISSFCKILEKHVRGMVDDRAHDFMDRIQRGAERMGRLIDGLLAFARVGYAEHIDTPVDVRVVVDSVLESLAELIDRSGAHVVVENLPVVAADPIALEQLFANLIKNAIKYQGDEPPRVTIRSQQEGDEWRFMVADNGIGIDAKHHGTIFKPFSRLHTDKRYAGNGIGLMSCKKVVENHGGRIWVNSEPGRGATFCFTLPLSQPRSNPHAA